MSVKSEIINKTVEDHQHILEAINILAKALLDLPNDVQWGEAEWAQDSEILDFVRIQTVSLRNTTESAVNGYYREAYHLIRMIYEGYFLLRLISTCDKFPIRYKLKSARNDANLDQTKNRIIERIEKELGSRLVRTYMEDRNTLVAIVKGLAIVDQSGKDTGVTLLYYYSAWRQFRPTDYFLKREAIQTSIPTLRYLAAPWADFTKSKDSLVDINQKMIYRYFLNFDRILENLRLNGVINKKISTRILVHYNFLSRFTHSTSDSINSIPSFRIIHLGDSNYVNFSYDHYHSELLLLYVCHLLLMHLQHILYYLAEWRSIYVRNQRKIYRALIKSMELRFGYFWFIFNSPHEYDRFCHANRKSSHKRKIRYRPEDIRWGDVRYYDDPFYRLKQMHQSQRELISGNEYNSPFPRNDVLYDRCYIGTIFDIYVTSFQRFDNSLYRFVSNILLDS